VELEVEVEVEVDVMEVEVEVGVEVGTEEVEAEVVVVELVVEVEDPPPNQARRRGRRAAHQRSGGGSAARRVVRRLVPPVQAPAPHTGGAHRRAACRLPVPQLPGTQLPSDHPAPSHHLLCRLPLPQPRASWLLPTTAALAVSSLTTAMLAMPGTLHGLRTCRRRRRLATATSAAHRRAGPVESARPASYHPSGQVASRRRPEALPGVVPPLQWGLPLHRAAQRSRRGAHQAHGQVRALR